MKQATAQLRKGLDELKADLQVVPTKRAVVQTVDAEGNLIGRYHPDGSETAEDLLFRMSEKAFRALTNGSRIRVLSGGRAAEKSHATARYLLALGYERPIKVLCLRELQSTLADSSYALLASLIESDYRLLDHYRVLANEIRAVNGSRFIFRGLLNYTADSIKGFESFDVAWTDEAQKLSARSLRLLLPTIRKPGSFFIFSLNPEKAEDAVYSELIEKDRPDTHVAYFTYLDNPFVSEEIRALAELDRRRDYSNYAHIWLGELLVLSEARIFRNFEVADFDTETLIAEWREADHIEERQLSADKMFASDFENAVRQRRKLQRTTALLYGIDWYPCAGTRAFFDPSGTILYVDHDFFEDPAFDLLADQLTASLPGIEHSSEVRADCARPELINHVRKKIPRIEAAKKWPGSVLDGIKFLQGRQRIIIHSRCEHLAEEFRLYSYKVDRHTEKVLNEPEDKNNHGLDALRYSIEIYVRKRGQYGYLTLKYA